MTHIGATSGSHPRPEAPGARAASTGPSVGGRMAEDSLANRAGRVLGLKATPLDPKHLAREVKFGVITGVPVEALMISQAYRRGDISAKTYAATTLSNSIAFGAWTVGGALVGAVVPGGLLVGGALGFAGGMLSHSVWNRTVGKHVTGFFEKLIPEGAAKFFGDNFNRFVANPLTDYVWKPVWGTVKKHKVLTGILAAGALMMLPGPLRTGLLKAGLTMVGGTAIGMAGDHFVLDRFLPKAPEQPGAKPREAGASALGEYDAQLTLDAETRAIVREAFPQVFPAGATLPPGMQSDLEKTFYVKLMALTSKDPAKAQELEATFEMLAARVERHYAGPAESGGSDSAPGSLAQVDAQVQLTDATRSELRRRYAAAFDWAGGHPPALVATVERVLYIQMMAETVQEPARAAELATLAGTLKQELLARYGVALETPQPAWGLSLNLPGAQDPAAPPIASRPLTR